MTAGHAVTRRTRKPRPQAHLEVENKFFADGARLVAGMDEVGRGAFAGPVTVGVTLVSPDSGSCPTGLTDSKLLSATERAAHEASSRAWCVAWGVGHADAAEIDQIGMTAALRRAGLRALDVAQRLAGPVDVLLLDGSHNWLATPQADLFASYNDELDGVLANTVVRTVVKGDIFCASISAASVLAKCERDRIMVAMSQNYPEYGWERNKGYGAAAHVDALRSIGPSPVHRVSWRLPTQTSSEDGR